MPVDLPPDSNLGKTAVKEAMQRNSLLASHTIPTPPILALLKASADPLRMQILKVLEVESFGVLELSQILDFKQSGMSHHLKALAGAGLVTSRREANWIYYQRADAALMEGLSELQEAILYTMDHIALDAEVEQRIDEVLRARTLAAEALFEANTDEFREMHGQISPYSVYGKGAADMLQSCLDERRDSVLEVGCGEGAFLAELSPRFKSVYALDQSSAMVERATAFVGKINVDNVEILQGDTSHAWLQDRKFDAIVMNMVLHHVAAPALQIREIAGLLKPGGRFFLCDLISHNQRSARENCGDVWLGFDESALLGWAQRAGLQPGYSKVLSQRNGLRVRLQEFVRPVD